MKKYALICEDNLTTAFCIKNMLEKHDYSCDIAANATETQELLNKKTYDLLTLDILLPDKNGLDLLNEIRNQETTKTLPVIIITATKTQDYNIEEYENTHWIEKTFDTTNIDQAIESIINNSMKNKIEILYVEHDNDLLTLIDITLSEIGNVHKVDNLHDAEKLLSEKHFDIIILDYVFPEGTSDKLIPGIKSGLNKDSKIIMFSAYEENKILKNYVDHIILKTNVSYEEFKNSIEDCITSDTH